MEALGHGISRAPSGKGGGLDSGLRSQDYPATAGHKWKSREGIGVMHRHPDLDPSANREEPLNIP